MDDFTEIRDRLASQYLEHLLYEPYAMQQEALLSWFTAKQGVLVCAPTGMGKTLIAEAAIFEALHLGKRAYYTTPLIALTDQKFDEIREAAERWGFKAGDVGLVTGNRRVNADAPILVVVAEILFNRLLHPEQFDFSDVWAVVMDEFHSFNDPERGIVWEFGLGLLPEHVRTLLLSATVGNAVDFVGWLRHRHHRDLELVQSDERKVPLSFQWVGDMLLPDLIEEIASGTDEARRTPALVFCFNRDECWRVAELLKGKRVVQAEQQKQLASRLDEYDFKTGAGPKLRQILIRGVGVHHAGVLPKYRRIVEELFQDKLLTICVCTETLAAGINLPARSVILPNLLKGPPDKKRLIDPSSAHQMFGRAGRPQFDTQGFVYAVAHEDDVKILRWKEKYDQIPENTKDPGLLKAKKQLKKKMPKRREGFQYWNETQFQQLRDAKPGKLWSRGPLPWRMLAYMLEASPEVDLIRKLVEKRLLEGKRAEHAIKDLRDMLLTLWRGGYVELEPKPNLDEMENSPAAVDPATAGEPKQIVLPERAIPNEKAKYLAQLRGVDPLYGMFLVNHLGIANRAERLQALESILELPTSLGRGIRPPNQDELPPGPLQTERLDEQLLRLGLATAEELGQRVEEDEEDTRRKFFDDNEERVFVLRLADKLQLLFQHDFPGVREVKTSAVWVAGEVLEFGGNFDKYITAKGLQKQEGVIFRHLLRLILLIDEFAQICPPETTIEEWQEDLYEVANILEEACRVIDPMSTEKTLAESKAALDEL